jgi:iron complex outermembrane receptor protein
MRAFDGLSGFLPKSGCQCLTPSSHRTPIPVRGGSSKANIRPGGSILKTNTLDRDLAVHDGAVRAEGRAGGLRTLALGVSATALLSMAAPVGAWAQTAPAAQPAAAPAGLAEIVVTARKTKENLLTVPLSITALSSADLDARGVSNYKDLQNYTPGFKFINQSVNRNDRGYTSFIMRGMNPTTPLSYLQGVTVFLDGVPVSGGIIDGISDVDHVEVVKGPQSAYFGRGTFAGAVTFITQDPHFTPHAKVDVTAKSFGTYDLTGEVEGPIWGDKLAGRLAIRDYHTDGQYTNPENQSERLGEQGTYSLTGQLLFKPTEKLTVKVYAKYFNDEDGPGATAWIYPNQFNCNAGAGPANIQYYQGKNAVCGNLPAFQGNSLATFTNIPQAVLNVFNGKTPALVSGVLRLIDGPDGTNNTAMGIKRDGYTIHSTAHYDLSRGWSIDANFGANSDNYHFNTDVSSKDLTGTVNPNYGSANPNFNSTNAPGLLQQTIILAHGSNIDTDISTEARLNTPKFFDVVKGMLGVSYYHSATKSTTTLFNNIGYTQVTPYGQNLAFTPAVFGSLSWDILHNLNVSFEGRYQSDSFESQSFRANLDYKATFNSFNPRAVLTYTFNPSSSVYVSYAEGTRPGLFNTNLNSIPAADKTAILSQGAIPLAVPEEHVTMYEAGFKTRFLDNRAQILAAVYYGDWTGRHIQDKVYYISAASPTILSNITFTLASGETKLYGAELEGRFQATSNLLLEATFDYAGTRIIKDYCADCISLTGNAFPTGTSMTGFPTTSGSLAGTYSKTILGHDAFLRLEMLYTGTNYVDEANITRINPYATLNFHLGVNQGPYRFEVFGTNITNTKSYLYAQRYSDSLPYAGSPLTTAAVNEYSASPIDKPMFGVRMIANF